jgi:uncharacterized membrane protein
LSSCLSQAKILGGTGSILLLLSLVPRVGFILGIIGFAFILVAMKLISDALSDGLIFNNMIIATVLGIAAILVLEIVNVRVITRVTNYLRDVAAGTAHPAIHFGALVVLLIIGLLVVWVLYLVSAFYLRRNFNVTAQRLNVGLFRTGAYIFMIGAALTVVLIGFLLIFVAEILFAIAFFTIPEKMVPVSPPPSGSMPTPSPSGAQQTTTSSQTASANRFCLKCGQSLPEGTVFCPSCGQKQT